MEGSGNDSKQFFVFLHVSRVYVLMAPKRRTQCVLEMREYIVSISVIKIGEALLHHRFQGKHNHNTVILWSLQKTSSRSCFMAACCVIDIVLWVGVICGVGQVFSFF